MAKNQLSEHQESLWMLAASPTIWAAHFLLAYVTAAIWCAKIGGSLGTVRVAIAVYTMLALVGIGVFAARGFRHHSFGRATVPHDFDSPADRHRFLGFATLLLSSLSAVAVIYTSLTILFVERCT